MTLGFIQTPDCKSLENMIGIWLIGTAVFGLTRKMTSNKKRKRELKKALLNYLRTPSGIRTLDPLIKSQLLYQLS